MSANQIRKGKASTVRANISQLTEPDFTKFSNQVGSPLEAILWNPIPMMPSDPLDANIELVWFAKANT